MKCNYMCDDGDSDGDSDGEETLSKETDED